MNLQLIVLFSVFWIFVNSQLNFKRWQTKYNISYLPNDKEFNRSRQTFDVSVSFVTVNKLRFKFGYELGLNGLADLPFQQFQKTHNGLVLPNTLERGDQIINFSDEEHLVTLRARADIPGSVDYRNYSLPVQNQKICNSCWAFSVVEALEIKLKMKNPKFNTLLSAQYVVDCDTFNYGCIGGWPTSAFNWIARNGGNAVPSTINYPYFGYKMRCRSTPKIAMNIKATVQDYTAGNENMMKEIVANAGPIVVAFHATFYFQLYSSGIFYDQTCDNRCVVANHAIVIVGYGTDSTTNTDYWIIKNSWGTSWGEGGYGYIARNKGNQCNIACWAMYTL
ncbi:hypothetical protein ACKWTF_013839 [Chironomus riparius]